MTHTSITRCFILLLSTSFLFGTEPKKEDLDEETHFTQEMTVTAEKRTTRLQKTPRTVSVVSGEAFEKAEMENMEDIAMAIPGLLITANDGSAQPYIRGIGTANVFVGSDSSVAFYLDGVYMSRVTTVFNDLIDIERVEVLKGPGGTLYGRNATGGSMNVISAGPEASFGGKLRLSGGSYNEARIGLTLNQPLIKDKLLSRISILDNSRDGYVTNVGGKGPKDYDDKNVTAFRLSFEYILNENIDLAFNTDRVVFKQNGRAILPQNMGLATLLGAATPEDLYHIGNTSYDADQSNPWPFHAQRNYGYQFILRRHSETGPSMNLNASWRENYMGRLLDSDATEIDIVDFRNDEDHQQWNLEYMLTSPDRKAFQWVAGVALFHEKVHWKGLLRLPFGVPVEEQDPGDILLDTTLKTDAAAIYFKGTWALSSRVNLHGGLRYNYENKHVNRFNQLGNPDAVFVEEEKNWDAFTPRLGLDFNINDNLFLYLVSAYGFKSGGFDGTSYAPAFDPEFVTSIEAGLKTVKSKYSFNANAFYYDYQDLQVQVFTGLGGLRVENAAEATVIGSELELEAQPHANIRINTAVSWLDASYDRFLAFDPFLGELDLAGKTMTMSPEWTLNTHLNWTFHKSEKGIFEVTGEYHWVDETKFAQFDDPLTTRDAFGLMNAGLHFTSNNKKWQLSLWARNLADKENYRFLIKLNFTPDDVIAEHIEPRMIGGSVTYKF